MNTRRRGSKRPCQVFQRRRLRATSARACSTASSVFFEAQALAAQELPDRIVRHDDAPCGQFVLEPVQCQVRDLLDPLNNEGAVRLQNTLAIAAHLAGPIGRASCWERVCPYV